MKEHYGYIAKDKDGFYWLGTFCNTKQGVDAHIDEVGNKKFGLKTVTVKFTEVGDEK